MSEPKLKKSLSMTGMVVYGVIFMVPIAPFGIFGDIALQSHGMVALTYLIGTAIMLFTALSYGTMAQKYPQAGSVYVYTSKALGADIGFLTGWVVLLDYFLAPALLYLISGFALETLTGLDTLLWVVLLILFNTFISFKGLGLTHRLNMISLAGQILLLLVFATAALYGIADGTVGGGFNLKPFFAADHFNLGFFESAIAISVLSFLGFDGISTLAEENTGSDKAVGRAMLIALGLIGVIFVGQSYLASLVVTDYTAFSDNPSNAFYLVARTAGGRGLEIACLIAVPLSWGVTNALAAQTAVARILFAMGRNQHFPRFLAKVHKTNQTPYLAIFFVGALTFFIALAFAANLEGLIYCVNFGALTAFSMLHISVFAEGFFRTKSKRYGRDFLCPLIGFISIAFAWRGLSSQSLVIGFVWLGLGVLYLLPLRLRGKKAGLEI